MMSYITSINIIEKYGECSIYSFDVFDTVITRTIAEPQGIFCLMQQYLMLNPKYKICNKELVRDFPAIRVSYEHYARQMRVKGQEEITLKNVYDYIGRAYNLSPELIACLEELEEVVEYQCSIPIRQTISDICKLIAMGKRVIFISDMYLSVKVIRKLLVKAEKMFASVPIYVSSEFNKTKSKGSLFQIVHEIENVEYHDWVHVGDNACSDQAIPQKLGIKTIPIHSETLSFFEKYLVRTLGRNVNCQIIVGASRLARNLNPNGHFMYQVGCNYGGPILTIYAEWLINQCQIRSISKLYFIARDGYILKQIVDKILMIRNVKLFTSYIYGSRKAWYIKKDDTERANLVRAYITQEVDLNDSNIAFVDSFGSGGSIESMADIVLDKQCMKWHAFFFKCGERNTPHLLKFDCAPFLDIWDNIELFCKAPEGPCIGYRKKDEKIEPVCSHSVGEQIKNFGFAEYENGVLVFLKYYLCNEFIGKYNYSGMDEVLYWYVKKINEFPDKCLRKFLQEYPRDERKKIKMLKISILERKFELKLKKIKNFVKVIEKKKEINLLK